MKKSKVFIFATLLALLLPFCMQVSHARSNAQLEQTGRQMVYLKLLLSQLRDAASSIREIENLTLVGMSESRVAAMRKAMELKVLDMQKETLITIHSL
ncbi:MAG: hypothetical protein Q9M22_00885 [Mariprofundaceae bacterium]|nr:hypothetical protein [Mariprofundaceae bacterium]